VYTGAKATVISKRNVCDHNCTGVSYCFTNILHY